MQDPALVLMKLRSMYHFLISQTPPAHHCLGSRSGENPTGGLWDLTVTDLRLKLKQLGLPVYGNKQDLIDRLESAEAEGSATEEVTEEVVEEPVVEVDEDATGSRIMLAVLF